MKKWLCYDESETFLIEAETREQAEVRAAEYEGVVVGPYLEPETRQEKSVQDKTAQTCCH